MWARKRKPAPGRRKRKKKMDELFPGKILLEQSRDGIVILDQDGRVYESNRKFADMLGYSLGEMETLCVFDWDCFFSREKLRDMMGSVNERGQHFETRHKRRDGSIYDVEISSNAAVVDGNRLIFCVCRDITDRKQISQSLQKSEARNRALLEAIPDMMFLFSKDGTFIDYHAPCGASLLADPDFFLGRNVHEVLPPNLADMTLFYIHKVMEKKEPVLYHYTALAGGGEKIFESRMTLCHDNTALSIVRDITDFQKAEQALKESESRLNLALTVAKIGYWMWEVSTGRVHWFSGHEKLFGIPMEEFGGTLDDVQRWVHPADRAQGIANFEKCLANREPFDNTYRVIHPDGSIHWLHSYGHLSCDAKGRPGHIFGVTQEITDQKRLESVLLEASEREQRRLGQELHDHLLQDLKSIEIELCLCEAKLKARGLAEARLAAELKEKINRAVQNAYEIASNMLPGGFDEKGLGEALEEMACKIRQKSFVQVECAVDSHCVPGSKVAAWHLFRVAQEALANAVNHSGASKIGISWGKRQELTGDMVLEVSDDGCGLFSRKHPVKGMGIEVMKSRASAMGARFQIQENPGGGTRVLCVLASESPSIPGGNNQE